MSEASDGPPRLLGAGTLAIALAAVLLVLVVLSARTGTTGSAELGSTLRGLIAFLGLGEPLERTQQTIVENRMWRTLVAACVGASLAYAGGLLQGVFRNGLASPAVIGVTSGASLGASIAILIIGGIGVEGQLLARAAANAPMLVTACSLVGALGVTLLVTAIATIGGRVSVPTLLLVGVAINVCIGGLLAGIQAWVLEYDWEVAQGIFAWTFGNLKDRSPQHAAVAFAGLAVAVSALPFVARELDLFAGGEEDAEALGVSTLRVKLLALGAAALAAACAVSVAGQIAFIGLVVPHMVRIVSGSSHRSLLPISLLAGAVFLLGTDYLNRLLLGSRALQPGVLMSIFGGPFFLFLLIRGRKAVQAW
ncbi:MAG: iron ABC transporter permease [bacterium]|nr:iron ABC transporter permease [bacterium]